MKNGIYYDYNSLVMSDGRTFSEISTSHADEELVTPSGSDIGITSDPVYQQVKSWLVYSPLAKRNLKVTYHYYWNPSLNCNCFRDCTAVSSYMTGFNWFVDWEQYACYANIVNSGRGLYARADGLLDYYLMINGVLKFYSQDVCMEHTFTNP